MKPAQGPNASARSGPGCFAAGRLQEFSMRAFLVILCLFAIGVVVAGSVLGWFPFATARTEQDRADPLTVEWAGATTDRDAGSGWLEFPFSSLEHEKDPPAATPAAQQDRTQFLQRAESRFKALESRVGELQAKAKHGRAVTREKMNESLDDLARKTATARLELR